MDLKQHFCKLFGRCALHSPSGRVLHNVTEEPDCLKTYVPRIELPLSSCPPPVLSWPLSPKCLEGAFSEVRQEFIGNSSQYVSMEERRGLIKATVPKAVTSLRPFPAALHS
jgi:hypothetical protein